MSKRLGLRPWLKKKSYRKRKQWRCSPAKARLTGDGKFFVNCPGSKNTSIHTATWSIYRIYILPVVFYFKVSSKCLPFVISGWNYWKGAAITNGTWEDRKAEGRQTPSEHLGFVFSGNQSKKSALLYLEQIQAKRCNQSLKIFSRTL